MYGFFERAHSALYVLILFLLTTGFCGLRRRFRAAEAIRKTIARSRFGLEELARMRQRERRELIAEYSERESLGVRIDRELEYSGFKKLLPRLTADKLLAANLIVSVTVLIALPALIEFRGCLLALLAFWGMELLILRFGKLRNLRRVGNDLPKLLDFLGNYSLTGAELGSILGQISRYLDEPLRSVLEDCEAESRLTGDIGMALLAAADRIEHPQFRQFIRNLEITSRYSADFAPVITDGRRSLREYLRQGTERRTMLREACIHMALLGAMSVLVLVIVGRLVERSILDVLLGTAVGHLALGSVAAILLLFFRKMFEMNK